MQHAEERPLQIVGARAPETSFEGLPDVHQRACDGRGQAGCGVGGSQESCGYQARPVVAAVAIAAMPREVVAQLVERLAEPAAAEAASLSRALLPGLAETLGRSRWACRDDDDLVEEERV
jgi:hypothetical protein